MAHQEEFIDVRGTKIKMLRGGCGAPLLFFHGADGAAAWLPFFDLLAKDFTVLVPIHPGFAGSDGYDEIDTIHDLVFHYLEVIDQLKLERPFMVGASLGGWLAAELAVHHGERVGKLVLIDAFGLKVEGKLIADIFAPSPPELRRLVFHDPESELAMTTIPDVPTPQQLDGILRARQTAARIGWNPFMYDPKLRGRLYRIGVPTLIVWGDDDRVVPLEHAKAYQAGIAKARLVMMEKSGHAPVLENPVRTARVISEFLKSA
jgi:pimeloyl-ACP methyl ester carboxylesterase